MSSDGAIIYRSPAAGALGALVQDHVIQERVIFPAVGYLEMARAAVGTDRRLAADCGAD